MNLSAYVDEPKPFSEDSTNIMTIQVCGILKSQLHLEVWQFFVTMTKEKYVCHK